jgi:hypothetical protein
MRMLRLRDLDELSALPKNKWGIREHPAAHEAEEGALTEITPIPVRSSQTALDSSAAGLDLILAPGAPGSCFLAMYSQCQASLLIGIETDWGTAAVRELYNAMRREASHLQATMTATSRRPPLTPLHTAFPRHSSVCPARFARQTLADWIAVALALREQIVDAKQTVPFDSHDRKVDVIVHPDGILDADNDELPAAAVATLS